MKTDNDKLEDSQNAVANYIVKPFNAENGPLIMVRQLTPGKVTYQLWATEGVGVGGLSVPLPYTLIPVRFLFLLAPSYLLFFVCKIVRNSA